MARFTEYALASIGRFTHTVSAEPTQNGWKLTLRAAPVQPVMPSADLPSSEFFAAIAAQSVMVAVRETPRQYVGQVEVRPAVAAQELAREILGEGWTVEDKGRGFHVRIR